MTPNPPRRTEKAWSDPCLRLDFWQRDLIQSSFTPGIKRVAVKGCTKAGKGAAGAIIVNLWWYVHDPCKIILTGPNVKHTREGLFAEACTWFRLISDPRKTEVQAETWRWPGDEQKLVSIGNAETGEGFSGKHGPATLSIFDEASIIPDQFFNQSRTYSKLIYSASNPRVNSGWFRGMFPSANALPGPDVSQTIEEPGAKVRLVTVSGEDCANVKADREVIPAQVTRDMLADVLNPKGKPDWWPDCMGRGRFPREDAETQLILPAWMQPCHQRYHELRAGTAESAIRVCGFGLDVGASTSGDPSCLVCAGVDGVDLIVQPERMADTMQMVGWVLSFIQMRYRIDLTMTGVPIVVDLQGVGAGTYDRLRERGVNALPANEFTNKVLYANARAEKYGELSRRLDPAGEWAGRPWALPQDRELLDELFAHEKFYKSTGAFILTPKDRKSQPKFQGQTIREKIGRSPDKSDAVAYAYAAIAGLARHAIPIIRREILVASSEDMDKLPRDKADANMDPNTGRRLVNVRLEDLPTPQPMAFELEDIGSMAKRIALEMNAADDGGW